LSNGRRLGRRQRRSLQKIDQIGGFALVRKSPLEDLDLASFAQLHRLSCGFFLGSSLAVSQNHAGYNLIFGQNNRRYYPTLHFSFPLALASSFGILAFFE